MRKEIEEPVDTEDRDRQIKSILEMLPDDGGKEICLEFAMSLSNKLGMPFQNVCLVLYAGISSLGFMHDKALTSYNLFMFEYAAELHNRTRIKYNDQPENKMHGEAVAYGAVDFYLYCMAALNVRKESAAKLLKKRMLVMTSNELLHLQSFKSLLLSLAVLMDENRS